MFKREILFLKEQNLFRSITDRESPQGKRIKIKGKELINFASNDYLGLSNNLEIIETAIQAIKEYGMGGGASRLLAGGSILHRRLEEDIAGFKETEDALLFNSGYAANTGVIPAITSSNDLILSDELNHASIIDGCRLSRAKTIIYRHRDIGHIKDILSKEYRHINGRVVIVTDSVFSMDGDIAPLDELYIICCQLNSDKKIRAVLYIDDAHGTGVLGKGKGALKHFGLKNEKWIIQMGTLSKALGSVGAFVTGTKDLIDWLRNSVRPFIFSTALPAPVVASAGKALEIVIKNGDLIKRLWENRKRLMEGLLAKGFDTGGSETPIIPIIIDNVNKILSISGCLHKKGFYVPSIRPPSVKSPRLRITVTALHREDEIDQLINDLSACVKALQ